MSEYPFQFCILHTVKVTAGYHSSDSFLAKVARLKNIKLKLELTHLRKKSITVGIMD
jgi:hypothetical protein